MAVARRGDDNSCRFARLSPCVSPFFGNKRAAGGKVGVLVAVGRGLGLGMGQGRVSNLWEGQEGGLHLGLGWVLGWVSAWVGKLVCISA